MYLGILFYFTTLMLHFPIQLGHKVKHFLFQMTSSRIQEGPDLIIFDFAQSQNVLGSTLKV